MTHIARIEKLEEECRGVWSQSGDLLWVREAWARDDEDGCVMYRADVGKGGDADDWERGRVEGAPRYRWRPSIHMRRVDSRITLEIVAVRVERLQEIVRGDAMAEGCPFQNIWDANPWVWVIDLNRAQP